MACGCVEADKLTIAHIVPNLIKNINVVFGEDNNYVNDIDAESVENYLVLCGTHGCTGTCHDLYGNMKISMYYDPNDEMFKWYRARNVHVNGLDDRVLKEEQIGRKYLRLLAWRTLRTVLQPGPNFEGTSADRAEFINMLKISEETECTD